MRTFLTTLFSIIAIMGASQGVELPDDFRSEQIFLSPERSAYDIGDTIRVSGVVTCISRDGTRPFSRYLYLELIGPADTVEIRQKLPCHDSGRFTASVPTDLLGSGTYYLRAYTQLMRNFNPLSFAFQPLMIGDRKKNDRTGLKCYTATENGNLMAGRLQKIVGVITDTDNIPVAGREVRLMDENGDTIASTISSTSGYASFSFIPAENHRYELAADEFRFALPKPGVSTSPSISGTIKGNRLTYSITGQHINPEEMRIYVYDRMNGISFAAPRSMSGTIALERTPDVATVFLSDKNGSYIAQFTAYNPVTDIIPLMVDSNISRGATINFTAADYEPSDSVTIMARLLKADEQFILPAEAMLLYTADYSSPLPFPQRYAMSNSRERAQDLQAWLSTATFKRFTLKDALDDEKEIYRYMPEFSMAIRGTAKDQAKRPLRNGRLVAFDAWSMMPFDTEICPDGTFTVETGDYQDGTEFFLQWLNKKDKPENAVIELADASYPAVKLEKRADAAAYYTDYGRAGITENVHELGDIVVRAPIVKQNRFEEKVFYGHRAKNREKIQERGYLTLLDILQDLPTLTVAKATLDDPEGGGTRGGGTVDEIIAAAQKESGIAWVIKTHRGSSTLGADGAYVPLYIDGNLYEPEMYDMAFGMPANDVESVEFLTPAESLVFTSNCLNGVVSVKTRSSKIMSREKVEAKGVIVTPPGLSIAKPQYKDLKAPDSPGNYVLHIDVITPSGIHSSAKPVSVR